MFTHGLAAACPISAATRRPTELSSPSPPAKRVRTRTGRGIAYDCTTPRRTKAGSEARPQQLVRASRPRLALAHVRQLPARMTRRFAVAERGATAMRDEEQRLRFGTDGGSHG
jgi:hypothetical protein